MSFHMAIFGEGIRIGTRVLCDDNKSSHNTLVHIPTKVYSYKMARRSSRRTTGLRTGLGTGHQIR